MQLDPPTYTAAAERCVSTRNSFIADDTCLDYYYTLGERNSAAEVNNAAFAICGSQRCKNRLSSYTDYLTTCRIESVLDDDDDDDEVRCNHYVISLICISKFSIL